VVSVFKLDERLCALRGASVELARELRAHALAVDTNPHDMGPHLGLAAYEMTRSGITPLRFGGRPLRVGRFEYPPGSCLEQVVQIVEFAYGDAGVVMACPGPSLAGVLVDELGDDAQQERFYGALADGRTWAFFAMTEPGRGSDASALETRLSRESPGLYRLSGVKRYIGNGARGDIGVVFARTGGGPLSIRAALIEAAAPGVAVASLDMIGLRGACLGEIRLDGVPVPDEMLLGRHLPTTRRGLWGAVRVFNDVRARIAAFATGTGLALVDLVRAERPNAPGAERLTARLDACRQLVYAAGAAVDRNPDTGRPSSVAKIAAVALARETSRWAVRSLSPAALVEHPLLEKWTRDVCAFEFMEGTSDIQRQHVAKAYLKERDHGLQPVLFRQ
jgi:acyl-CoA dehydrogenase